MNNPLVGSVEFNAEREYKDNWISREEEFWKKKDERLYAELMEWKKYAGKRLLVICFTGNAGWNAEKNHPNLIYPIKIARVKGLPERLVGMRV